MSLLAFGAPQMLFLGNYNLDHCRDESSQHRRLNKRIRSRRIVCSSSDDEGPSMEFDTVASTERVAEKGDLWTVNTINSVTLLHNMDDNTGITSCKYYIGGAFTLVPFHVEHELLSSIPFFVLELQKYGMWQAEPRRVLLEFFCINFVG